MDVPHFYFTITLDAIIQLYCKFTFFLILFYYFTVKFIISLDGVLLFTVKFTFLHFTVKTYIFLALRCFVWVDNNCSVRK